MTSMSNTQDIIEGGDLVAGESLEDNKAFGEAIVKVEVCEAEGRTTPYVDPFMPTPEKERRLVRKVDLMLLSILGFMWAVKCIDRNRMVSFSLSIKH